MSAEPASPAPELEPELELELELEVDPEPEPAVGPGLADEPEPVPALDESPAHDEPVPGSVLVPGVVDGEVVVVLGSVLVVSVVEVVVVVVSVLCVELVVDDGVELAGAKLSELVAGQPAVVVGVVVVAGVDPASTVGSV